MSPVQVESSSSLTPTDTSVTLSKHVVEIYLLHQTFIAAVNSLTLYFHSLPPVSPINVDKSILKEIQIMPDWGNINILFML